jgi:tRNA dimethylallyltransferase
LPLAVVGPTAVGKSSLAIELAVRHDGEVVSVDSRCVYRGMDVGTAKPTPEERRGVPHHLIDVAEPDDEYSVARFLDDASATVADITSRGRLPILVGGTGYWLRALLGGGTSAAVPPNRALRDELAALPPEALLERLRGVDPAAAEAVDRRNPRRLARAIEVVETTGRPYAEAARAAATRFVVARPAQGESLLASAAAVRPDARQPIVVHLLGLTLPRDLLYDRIDRRYDEMVRAGWLDEVRALLERYPRELAPLRSFGYAEVVAHLHGELTLAQALERAKARCRRYARSQYSWFRLDDPTIEWHDAREGLA